MATLGELSKISSISIPIGFVLTASATRHFLPQGFLAEVNRRMQILAPDDLEGLYKTCTTLQQMVLDLPLPTDLQELLSHYYSSLEKVAGQGCLVALRSSAFGEDSAAASFAGLYRSELFVEKNNLQDAYRRVIASKYSAKAIFIPAQPRLSP